MKKNYVIIAFVFIFILASFLRLYKLDNRPAHFDEGGGHAIGSRALLERGEFIYNPDFHGPFLYHVTALAFYLFGMSDITLRITQAIFGIATVAILWLLKDHINNKTLLSLSLLIAVSPSLVYYSRFAVHDSYFVFFTVSSLVFLFLYTKTFEKKHLYFFAASMAFLFTVKENAYIFLGTIGIAFLIELLIEFFKNKENSFNKKISKNLYIKWLIKNKREILVSFLIFLSIFVVLYTSFLRYPKNFITAVKEPFIHWFRKSTTEKGFFQPHSFYLRILEEYDLAIFLLGLFGILMPIFANNKYTRFISIFASLNLTIYLAMPYKEPNNVVHIVLPLALSAASLIEFSKDNIRKYLFIAIIILSFYSIYVVWQTSFIRYSDEKNYLVYVQTVDDIKPMLQLIKKVTDERGKDISIVVNIPETEYPLSWYFRDYTNVSYLSDQIGPAYWKNIIWSGDGKAIWDNSEYKTGKRSGKIEGNNGTDGEWRQKITIDGPGYYNLSGWIKTHNLQPIDAWKYGKLYIRTDKNDEPDEIIAETSSLTGTNDWTFVSTRFYVDRGNILWLTMPIGNWGKTKGEIWFDDIYLSKENSNINLIKNPSFEEGNSINEYKYAQIIIFSQSTGLGYDKLEGYEVGKYVLRPGVNLVVYIKS